MHIKKLTILFVLLLTLFGCSQNNVTNNHSKSEGHDENVEFTKYSRTSSDNFINQDEANKAKKILSKYEEIKAIKAINTPDRLVIAVKVHHNKRFQLEKLREKFSQKIKKEFPKLKTTVSTDQKVWIELDQMEQAINTDKISNKKMKEKVKHIIKLSKEKA